MLQEHLNLNVDCPEGVTFYERSFGQSLVTYRFFSSKKQDGLCISKNSLTKKLKTKNCGLAQAWGDLMQVGTVVVMRS